jgi:hypothetical protein
MLSTCLIASILQSRLANFKRELTLPNVSLAMLAAIVALSKHANQQLTTEPYLCGAFCKTYTDACAAPLKLPADYCKTHSAVPDAYYCYPYAADADFVVSHAHVIKQQESA